MKASWQKQVIASNGYLELGMFEDAAQALEEIEPEDKTRNSWDFVADQTENGSSFRILTLLDEHTRQCLASGFHKRRFLFRAREVLAASRALTKPGETVRRRAHAASSRQDWILDVAWRR